MSKSTDRLKFFLNILLIIAPVLEEIFRKIDEYRETKDAGK